jgi:hypothetical protein
MGVRLKSLFGALTLTFFSTFLIDAASGQTATPEAQPTSEDVITVRDAFRRAYYRNDENFFFNRGFVGQLNWIFGPYIENEITRDGRAVDRLYEELLEQQVASDPTIRTPDLENPFDTSYLLLPTTAVGQTTGQELVPEAPLPAAPLVAPAPAAPEPEPEASPVPALW